MQDNTDHTGQGAAGLRDGQVAVVIGGTGALGAGVVERLAAEGAQLAFNYHGSAKRAAELATRVEQAGHKAPHSAKVDISDASAVAAFIADCVERFGRIDTLVYAAGPAFQLDFISRIGPEEFSRVIDADLKGCFNAIHAVLAHLRASRGSIVAVTAAGVERALARDALSLTPKAAITTLIRHVALEEGRKGVRANCVAPGFIDGGLGAAILDDVGPDMARRIVGAIPLQRMGKVDEIAEAVAWLSSPKASYVTGTTIFVTGGMEL